MYGKRCDRGYYEEKELTDWQKASWMQKSRRFCSSGNLRRHGDSRTGMQKRTFVADRYGCFVKGLVYSSHPCAGAGLFLWRETGTVFL